MQESMGDISVNQGILGISRRTKSAEVDADFYQ